MKILIIDDDTAITTLLKESLNKEIFSVDCAYEGNKGLFMFRTNHYDLLIIDCNLPIKDGYQLVKEIRQEDKNAKIIILTVDSRLENKEEFFKLGIDDYVIKPFIFSELLSRIKAVIRRPNITQKSIYKIDDLSLDIDKHLVIREKTNIYLTFKEIMLLEFLFRNKGRVVSRISIMENIWDFNADPFSNTIESHILKLRKKINPNGKKRELIHTIKGRGYKLDLKKW